MEELSIITVKRLKDTVERILHVPGNYRGGILEMAVVADTGIKPELLGQILPQVLKALKQQGQIFRNVRFNYVIWRRSGIENRVCPMMQPMMESFYEDVEFDGEEKDFGELIDYLKVFQARAKLILLLTNQDITELDSKEKRKQMQPFLEKKLLIVKVQKPEEISIYYRKYC